MTAIAVIVPTLRRPDSLVAALTSLQAQQGLSGHEIEIVVVDNDRAPSSRTVVDGLAPGPLAVRYVHEPTVGVASARNAGLAATGAGLIAFLDDDEIAAPTWLSALIAAQADLETDVVFGPIRGRAPDARGALRDYLEVFFSRHGPDQDAVIDQPYGCGNSLMVRATALPGPAPFDPRWNRSGGEDDALFTAISMRGGRFGWASRAWVDEAAPAHRARLGYALSRAFAYGQGPAQAAHGRRDPIGVARWMAVGAAQVLVWGMAALGLGLIRHPRRFQMMDRAVRGLGKILWMPGLEPKFYGLDELRRLDRKAAAVRPTTA